MDSPDAARDSPARDAVLLASHGCKRKRSGFVLLRHTRRLQIARSLNNGSKLGIHHVQRLVGNEVYDATLYQLLDSFIRNQ